MRPEDSPGKDADARLPLQCDDLSGFAKRLRAQLLSHHADHVDPPGHLALLNMLARAAGHRNLQALQADVRRRLAMPVASAFEPEPQPEPLPPVSGQDLPLPPLTPGAAKALAQLDTWGRLTRWPQKFTVQRLAMWVLWTRFESGRTYSEREVNELLKAWTVYGDHVTPRRELVEMGLLARKPDCSAYWKQPQRPDAEVQALLRAVRARRPLARQAAGAVHATIAAQ